MFAKRLFPSWIDTPFTYKMCDLPHALRRGRWWTEKTEDDHKIDVTAASGAAILCLKLKLWNWKQIMSGSPLSILSNWSIILITLSLRIWRKNTNYWFQRENVSFENSYSANNANTHKTEVWEKGLKINSLNHSVMKLWWNIFLKIWPHAKPRWIPMARSKMFKEPPVRPTTLINWHST